MKTHEKPMLTEEQLVQHLEEKGVTFILYSKDDAISYMRNNNNYFKLASYRKNYEKYQGGKNDGKYLNLDFGYLRDLAIIDMKLRYTLVQLSLDIEHYAKMDILRRAEIAGEDGYSICKEFLDSLNMKQQKMVMDEIDRNKNTVYCGDLVSKYPIDFPIWVFLELIPFGWMISLYKFCAERYNDKEMKDQYYMLRTCKDVRNASAHSSCILNDLHASTELHAPKYLVTQKLSLINDISGSSRSRRMNNVRIREIVTMLFIHNDIVTSEGVHLKAVDLLSDFEKRMMKNIDYYKTNDLVKVNFVFLKAVIDNWYPKI